MLIGRVFAHLTDMSYRRPVRTSSPLYTELVRGGRPVKKPPEISPLQAFMRRMKKRRLEQDNDKRRGNSGDRIAG